MSREIDTSRTLIERPFAGRTRKFQLRYGEIEALERQCGVGIGEVMLRLGTHRFKAADIWETVRLGLEGAGMPEMDATAVVMPYHATALAGHLQLAADIISAAVTGVPAPGKPEGAADTAPATSPKSTSRRAARGSARSRSGGSPSPSSPPS